MVNEKKSTKRKILKILREEKKSVSGEELAALSGISRVAVWKAIRSLQNDGYGISTERTGYVLQKDLKDVLFPWEFGDDEKIFFHFSETKSTMNEARKIAWENSAEEIQIVTADRQTDGRGQSNRKWKTLKGSVACTIVTHNAIPVQFSARMVMACQLAVVSVLEKISGEKFFVRWQNDVWSSGGKVCGVLSEIFASGGICVWQNLGVGINISSSPSVENADSVFHGETKTGRREILSLLLDEFKSFQKIALENSAELENAWNEKCPDVQKKIRAENSTEEFIFKGTDFFGSAVLECSDGSEKKFLPGEIRLGKKSENGEKQ
jgi:BirA family biotin operon repressor/biotin-[acetyl-CoA-carboxylase] ligase